MKKKFTLIEIITVIVIIIILINLVIGMSNIVIKNNKIRKTKSEIVILESFIEKFYDDKNYYPIGNASFDLRGESNTRTDFFNYLTVNKFERVLSLINRVDPYGNQYRYRSSAESTLDIWISNKKSFDLWSMGEDGISQHSDAQANNDGDDIGNWSQ